jgi:hypothetical protein
MIIWREQKSYAIKTETADERVLSDSELKSLKVIYLKTLRGKVFINKATRIPIEVNREIKDEMISKIHVNPKKTRPVARIKLLALDLIPYFLMDSDPDSLNEPDYKGRSYIEASHVFKHKCTINNIRFLVRIRTRKIVGKENRLYFLSFEDLTLSVS